jgi:hypothetical protein
MAVEIYDILFAFALEVQRFLPDGFWPLIGEV